MPTGVNLHLAGKRFGHLTAIRKATRSENPKRKPVRWLVRCDCGAETFTTAQRLTDGRAAICNVAGHNFRGKQIAGIPSCNVPGYKNWECMKQRCFNPNDDKYPRYGAAGVTVCDRWRDSFDAFISDMGPRPSPQHSIDRYPDPAGNYEPGNCRWATPLEQRHNRRPEVRQ